MEYEYNNQNTHQTHEDEGDFHPFAFNRIKSRR